MIVVDESTIQLMDLTAMLIIASLLFKAFLILVDEINLEEDNKDKDEWWNKS